MDTLSTLGLVVNITTLIEQSYSLARQVTEVYNNGETFGSTRLREVLNTASAVTEACSRISSCDVSNCATKAVEAARKFGASLNKIRYNKDGRERNIADKMWRVKLNPSQVEELHENFDNLQQALQTALLRDICSCLAII